MAGIPPPPQPPPYPKFPDPPQVDPGVVQLGQLMTVLGQDPRYRTRILGLIKEAAPGVPIPELDLQQGVATHVARESTALREENKKLGDRLGRLEGDLQQRTWMEQNGVDEEEYQGVVTLAKEKKIGDPDTALDYFRKSELGRPRQTNPGAALTEESRRALYKNPKQWALAEGERILKESRRRRQIA